MTVFVLGAGGQMGTAFAWAAEARGFRCVRFERTDCDVRDEASLETALQDVSKDDVVVNAAARLSTSEAEERPSEQLETNVRGAMQAALAAHRRGGVIVHLSTDYVFDGAKNMPYVESDAPNPINMYGALKLASELLVRRANPKHIVVRISSVFGHASGSTKRNFVDRMLAAAASTRQVEVDEILVMSPTYALHAANLTLDLIAKDAPYGVYHGANAGACSWFEFTQAIFEEAGVAAQVVPRDGSDTVPRPANSSLKSERLPSLGISVRPWREGLAAYLAETKSSA